MTHEANDFPCDKHVDLEVAIAKVATRMGLILAALVGNGALLLAIFGYLLNLGNNVTDMSRRISDLERRVTNIEELHPMKAGR